MLTDARGQVSRARGQTLLLLNSDVVPASPGWLSKLIGFYHGLEKPGAVGPKLIYEDSSLQHAGLYFDLMPGTDMWMNEHFYKGLYSDLPAANVTRVVPAVTGACLMIDARLYASVGGLSGTYIQGDYEDSDLCLRLNEAGRKNWYFPDVVLFHLEGQSYPTPAREINTQYNRWLFNEIWGDVISGTEAFASNDVGTGGLTGIGHQTLPSSRPGRPRESDSVQALAPTEIPARPKGPAERIERRVTADRMLP